MTMLKKQYADLLALTQLYLFQEYSLQERIFADSKSYEEFKKFALKQKGSQPPTIQPQKMLQKPATEPFSPPQPIKKTTPLVQPTAEVTAPAPKVIPPKIEEAAAKENVSQFFVLEPLETIQAMELDDFRTLIREKFPSQVIDEIPSDTEARNISHAWKHTQIFPEVILLSFHEADKQRLFLENICLAIEAYGIKASVLSAIQFEQENSWNNLLTAKGLRLILANNYALHTLSGLLKHYKEIPKKGQQYLGKIPLLFLSDLALYLKEPFLKPSLWNAIQEILFPPASAL